MSPLRSYPMIFHMLNKNFAFNYLERVYIFRKLYICKKKFFSQKGHGLADLLWDEIKKDNNCLFWRSKISNPINSWYFRRAQASWQTNEWMVFWYGKKNHFISENIIKYATDLDSSFMQNIQQVQKQTLKF